MSNCRVHADCRRVMLGVCLAALAVWPAPSLYAQGQPPAAQEPEAHELAQQPAAPPDSAAYLLVIDRSGSMTRKMPSGHTRWQEMQHKAIEFIGHVPLESRVWLAVFAGEKPQPELPPFRTEQDRQALVARIQNAYGAPEGGTALYDTLGMAFEEAERLSRANPGRHISVLAYTDGKDEGSTEWNPERLQERFAQLVAEDQNLWLFYTRIGDEGLPLSDIINEPHASEGSFKNPLPVTLAKSTLGLKNPVVNPRQTVELEFIASDAIWKLLEGTTLSFAYTSDEGQPIAVSVPAVPFHKGPVPVTLEVTNPDDLQADQEYSGALAIVYPVLDRYEVKAGDQVRVTFQKGERVQIYDRRPADGATFAAGQPVHFWVSTLDGAKVLWDFGDQASATGSEARHVYNTAGQRTVSVSAEADPRIGPTRQQFTIQIIDVGVSVDPLAGLVVEGAPVTFTCTGRGPLERFEWIIDGQKYDGRPPDDPAATGSRITYTFDRAAAHVVSVVGYAEKAVVQAEERVIDVIEKPTVAIVEPQAGDVVHFAQEHLFRAQVNGPVHDVTWILKRQADDGDDFQVLAEVTRPVIPGPQGRVSELAYSFAESPDEMDVLVEASGGLPAEIDLAPPAHRVALRVEYPTPTPSIELTGNPPFAFGKPVQFTLNSPQGFTNVAWDFGDGRTDRTNNPSPLHRYGASGPFEVKAQVTGKGGRKAVARASINVVSVRPEARPRVLAGDRDVQDVRVGETVQLRDESSGDIVARAWFHNGRPLPSDQLSLPLDQPGRHRIKLHVQGPPDKSGAIAADEKEIVFSVHEPYNHYPFVAALAIALIAWCILAWLLLRNAPRRWRLYYSNQQPPNELTDPMVRLSDGWNWWRKTAEIPLPRLYGHCDYWGSGEGARETLAVHPLKQGPQWTASVVYSGEGNDRVTSAPPREDGTRLDYRWTDRRCPDEAYRTMHLRLVKLKADSAWPAVLLAAAGLALAAALWWVYDLVYHGGIS